MFVKKIVQVVEEKEIQFDPYKPVKRLKLSIIIETRQTPDIKTKSFVCCIASFVILQD